MSKSRRNYYKARSFLYMSYPSRGWPEDYQGKTRKFVKRNFHKTRRAKFKQEDRNAYSAIYECTSEIPSNSEYSYT